MAAGALRGRPLPGARGPARAPARLRRLPPRDLPASSPEYTCLLGTMVQEAYATHPAIRAACEREITGHAADARARHRRGHRAPAGRGLRRRRASPSTSRRVLQGAFILAKATGDARGCRRQPWPSPPLPHIALRPTTAKGGTLMSYVDGFVVAVPTANREAYRKHADEALAIFKEHGATALRRMLGRRRARGQGHLLPHGGEAQGRRDRGLLLGRVAVEGGPRRRHGRR